MEDIKYALKKIYPWARDIKYTSKSGKLNVDIRYTNEYQCRRPDFDEIATMIRGMLFCHGFLSIVALCAIPNPIWANIVFGLISILIGIGACCIDDDMSTAEYIFAWAINLIMMLLIVLIVWQIQTCNPEMPQNVPKFFSFLCKFKF